LIGLTEGRFISGHLKIEVSVDSDMDLVEAGALAATDIVMVAAAGH